MIRPKPMRKANLLLDGYDYKYTMLTWVDDRQYFTIHSKQEAVIWGHLRLNAGVGEATKLAVSTILQSKTPLLYSKSIVFT